MDEGSLRVFGEADDRTVQQMRNCLRAEEGSLGALMPDNHLGYSQPVGGVHLLRDHISVSGVGYDIGCGNKAVRTDISDADLGPGHPQLPGIMDEISRRIGFGVGQPAKEQVDHPVLDEIDSFHIPWIKDMAKRAKEQLGTVGAGNHYVDLFVGDDGYVWVGVHFGSRGFGHKIATGFMHIADGNLPSKKGDPEGEPMSAPKLLQVDSYAGEGYIGAMELAGKYAYAGRDVVVDKVLDILGARATFEVHNHHNYAWRESHMDEDFWVVRKGATPAFDGQLGFVGATMGEDSVILEGTPAAESEAYASTVHGAGRAMSRTRAAGKMRRRWTCLNRDCDWFQPPHTHKPDDGKCPECGHDKLKKRMVQMSPGEVDWDEAQDDLRRKQIELRGAAADEAPGAYKRLDAVLAACGESVRVRHTLTPIGVAMAPADTFDPFKD